MPKHVDSLDALRREIDAIDEEMHTLLMRRGEVIERLVAAKRGGEAGSALRPGREAQMLRRIAERHEGALPLATVEHIWREIIGTFTQLQAPFRVHATGAAEPAMRDLLRFHFGFSAPLVAQPSPEALVAALGESRTDLGVISLDLQPSADWWSMLSTEPGGVKIVAAVPFLSAGDPHWPRSLVLGPAAIANPDATIFAYAADGEAAPGRLTGGAVEILASADGSVLVASSASREATRSALADAGLHVGRLAEIGSYSAPSAE